MVDQEKWQKMTIFEQLGNIYSEISRASGWQEKDDLTAMRNSLDRVLELINLTLDDKRHVGRLKEVARLQELVADNYAGEKRYDVSLSQLSNYLLPFAIKARNN